MAQASNAGQMARFALVGGLNTAAGLGAIVFAQSVLQLDAYLANLCGYAVGLTVSFTLNARWTFAGAKRPGASALFLLAFAIAYGVNLAMLTGLLHLGASRLFAQASAFAAYSATFFVLSKFVVFRPLAPAARSS